MLRLKINATEQPKEKDEKKEKKRKEKKEKKIVGGKCIGFLHTYGVKMPRVQGMWLRANDKLSTPNRAVSVDERYVLVLVILPCTINTCREFIISRRYV